MKPKLYLAGPNVFHINAKDIGEALKALCTHCGCEGLFPLDNEIDLEQPEAAHAIYLANLELIRRCNAVIADITPFRGPHMDPGTAFEIGYARAIGKPTFLYSRDRRTLIHRFENRKHRSMEDMEHGIYRDENYMLIEAFGLSENLMITPSNAREHRVYETAMTAIDEAAVTFGAAQNAG